MLSNISCPCGKDNDGGKLAIVGRPLFNDANNVEAGGALFRINIMISSWPWEVRAPELLGFLQIIGGEEGDAGCALGVESV